MTSSSFQTDPELLASISIGKNPKPMSNLYTDATVNTFYLDRLEDIHGVSGTGRVAVGVQFANGKCVLNWLTKNYSVCVYDNIETLTAIHEHGGKTKVTWESRN